VDTRPQLVALVSEEAAGAEPERAEDLRSLAAHIEALAKKHPAARVLTHLHPADAREFPNEAVRALVHSYQGSDEEGFLYNVIDVYQPGMGSSLRLTFERDQERAAKEFSASPAGWARIAFERGDQVFQLTFD
jgi:hypothetical protein